MAPITKLAAVTMAPTVARVTSPSTNHTIELGITPQSAQEPLVGHLLVVEQNITTGGDVEARELALGTVSEVQTRNRQLENPAVGEAAITGHFDGVYGGANDARSASIKLHAAYRYNSDADEWRPAGASLSTSPNTGQQVRRATSDALDALTAGDADVHYLGHLAGPASSGTYIRVPMTIRDFSGPLGAFHLGIFGQSGSGKSSNVAYVIAGQLRHTHHGVIMIDPQGQWSHEAGLPFSLQTWAQELGRDVVVRRIAEDLRLEKDAGLLCTLLGKTRFCRELLKMSGETQELLLEEMEKQLRKQPEWETQESNTLLRALLQATSQRDVVQRIYADESRQDRLIAAFDDILHDDDRFGDVAQWFNPLHNLFAETNPAGDKRHSLWGTLSSVFDKEARGSGPAPLLILDMSTSAVSWLNQLIGEEAQRAAEDALAVLDQDSIKAAILRRAAATLKRAAEHAFRSGGVLNTAVYLDEAWRFVPNPHTATDPEIADLARDFEGYARDFRKFGIGLGFITQSPRSISPAIWDQLLIKVIGYGLAGPDLDRVAEQLDDRDSLRLYRSFAPPESSRPALYPFMYLGPVSPLAVTKTPIFVATYTDFDQFRSDNDKWITHIARQQGVPVGKGTPTRDGAPKLRRNRPSAHRARPELQRSISAHRDNGGVDPGMYIHKTSQAGYGATALDPLGISTADRGPNGRPLDPDTGAEFPF